MKINRHIAILLSFCFAVYLGHNLVPHHHHTEVVNAPVGSECPVEHSDNHGEDHNGENHPIHCHAFNDVVFDKYSTSAIQPPVRLIQEVIPAISLTHLDPPAMHGTARYLSLKIPDISLQTLGARPLRAPPVFA